MVKDISGVQLLLLKGDSLLPGCCVVPLLPALSGWWCGPPEGGWMCPCLHSLTAQWSSSTWPAQDVPYPLAAAHTGFETTALQRQKEYCMNKHWSITQGRVQCWKSDSIHSGHYGSWSGDMEKLSRCSVMIHTLRSSVAQLPTHHDGDWYHKP